MHYMSLSPAISELQLLPHNISTNPQPPSDIPHYIIH